MKDFRNIILTQPVGYHDSVHLIKNAKKIVTDSGGLQCEAFYAGVQCIFVLDFVVWPETMVDNRNQLAKANHKDILEKLSKQQTINPDYPVISFEFIKPYDPNPMCSAANKEIVDIMCSTFSSSTEKVALTEYDTRRKCKTIKDYCYTREKKASDEGRVSAIISIKTILERLNKYVMQIESIIQQCNRKTENQSYDIVLQLEKLADMKDKGIITQKEFIRLKKKLI